MKKNEVFPPKCALLEEGVAAKGKNEWRHCDQEYEGCIFFSEGEKLSLV
jgi:hypothetical protein